MSDTQNKPKEEVMEEPKLNLEEELNNSEDNNDLSELLKNIGNDENVSNLFKQFTSGFSNLNNSENNFSENDFNLYNENDESDDINIDSLNLDKYFISSSGKNICDVLLEVKDELVKLHK